MGNNTSSGGLSTPGIICIAAASYTVIILVLVFVRYILIRRGVCADTKCAPCGSEEGPGCCSCCQSVAESDGCKCDPSLTGCLNKCCPQSKKGSSCLDVCMCDCITNLDTDCCVCGTCPTCAGCDFSCQECQSINCCCFEIKIRQSSHPQHVQASNNINSFRQGPPIGYASANHVPSVINQQPISSHVASPSSAISSQEQLLHYPPSARMVHDQYYMNKAFVTTDEHLGILGEVPMSRRDRASRELDIPMTTLKEKPKALSEAYKNSEVKFIAHDASESDVYKEEENTARQTDEGIEVRKKRKNPKPKIQKDLEGGDAGEGHAHTAGDEAPQRRVRKKVKPDRQDKHDTSDSSTRDDGKVISTSSPMGRSLSTSTSSSVQPVRRLPSPPPGKSSSKSSNKTSAVVTGKPPKSPKRKV